jgi:hypothetical protein
LSCFEINDGALTGVHRVTVNAGEAISNDRVRWHAPKKYAQAATSGLTQEVAGPVQDLVINLSWEGNKPFVETIESTAEENPFSAN